MHLHPETSMDTSPDTSAASKPIYIPSIILPCARDAHSACCSYWYLSWAWKASTLPCPSSCFWWPIGWALSHHHLQCWYPSIHNGSIPPWRGTGDHAGSSSGRCLSFCAYIWAARVPLGPRGPRNTWGNGRRLSTLCRAAPSWLIRIPHSRQWSPLLSRGCRSFWLFLVCY